MTTQSAPKGQTKGGTASNGMPLSKLIDLFLVSKKVEGRSEKTLSWYRSNLCRYAEFAGDDGPATANDLSLQSGRAFVNHLQSQPKRYEEHQYREPLKGGLSPRSVHGYVRTLKAFGSWLSEEGYVDAHPFQRLKPPKLPETMIQILSDDEIRQLVAAINPKTPLGARTYAMFLLLLDTGIRASELVTLTLSNTYLDDGYVKVFGKGSKERMVPIGAATKKALMTYMMAHRPEPVRPETDNLFLTFDGYPMKYAGFAQAIRRLGVAASVPRLHPHLFRHTFAVRYLMNGGDVMTLRLILGHTTLDVTQMYVHLAESHVQVQHNRYSPVDRLGLGTRQGRAKRA